MVKETETEMSSRSAVRLVAARLRPLNSTSTCSRTSIFVFPTFSTRFRPHSRCSL